MEFAIGILLLVANSAFARVGGDMGGFDGARSASLVREMQENMEKIDWNLSEDMRKAGEDLQNAVESLSGLTELMAQQDSLSEEELTARILREEENFYGSMATATKKNTTATTTAQHRRTLLKEDPHLKALESLLKSDPKMGRFYDIHKAMADGDSATISKHINQITQRAHQSSASNKRSTAMGTSHRMLTKEEQCDDLVIAVKRYSFLDLFVALYKEDIDDDDGTFDNTAVRTENIFDKISDILGLVEDIESNPADSNGSRCNALLQAFHANLEGDYFTVYDSYTVNDVKRGVNPSQYLSISSVRSAEDPAFARQAELLFEDAIICGESLQASLAEGGQAEPSFFSKSDCSYTTTDDFNGYSSSACARFPIRIRDAGDGNVNKHGAAIGDAGDGESFLGGYFEFSEIPRIFDELLDASTNDIYRPRRGGGCGSCQSDFSDKSDIYDTTTFRPEFIDLLAGRPNDVNSDNQAKMDVCMEAISKFLYDDFASKLPPALADRNLGYYQDKEDTYGLRMHCNRPADDSNHKCEFQLVKASAATGDYDTRDDSNNWIYLTDDDGNDLCKNLRTSNKNCPYDQASDKDCENNGGKRADIFFDRVPTPWAVGKGTPESVTYDKVLVLVFGDDPLESGSTICRLAEEAENDPSKGKEEILPGYCCLDQPYNQAGDLWGYSFSCETGQERIDMGQEPCLRPAPLLAGFSEGVCSIYGGTYCPYPRSCQGLLDCIEAEKNATKPDLVPVTEAILDENGTVVGNITTTTESGGNKALYEYLKTSPQVSDPMNSFECGQVREYYGFDDQYPIDADICTDIQLLGESDQFLFLNQVNGGYENVKEEQRLELEKPERPSYSESGGQAWRSTNFALGQVLAVARELHDFVSDDSNCPGAPQCDAASASIFVCRVLKKFVTGASLAAIVAARVAFDVSEFTYDELVGNSDYQNNEIYLNTAVLYTNMKTLLKATYEANDETREAILETTRDILEIVTPPAYDPDTKFYGCNGIDENDDGIADECSEDSFPPELVVQGSTELELRENIFNDILQVVGKTFASTEQAQSAVKTLVRVVDDCAPVTALSETVSVLSTTTCDAQIEVVPFQALAPPCNTNLPGARLIFEVSKDESPPTIQSCGFAGQDTSGNLFVQRQPAQCQNCDWGSGECFYPVNGGCGMAPCAASGYLCDDASLEYLDFELQLTDDCSSTVDLEIALVSNEIDENSMGFLRVPSTAQNTDNGGTKFVVAVPKDDCARVNGKRACRGEEGVPRYYTVTVTATDEVGRVSQCSSTAIITGMYPPPQSGLLAAMDASSALEVQIASETMTYNTGA